MQNTTPLPLLITDFLSFQPFDAGVVRRFQEQSDLVLDTPVFRVRGSNPGIVTPDSVVLNDYPQMGPLAMPTIQGMQAYGGIFRFNWPDKHFGLFFYLGGGNMKIQIVCQSSERALGEALLKNLLPMYR